jgi:hypothetical protein
MLYDVILPIQVAPVEQELHLQIFRKLLRQHLVNLYP